MNTKQSQFASAVAQDLRALEHAFDNTLAHAGAFLQTLAEGRRTAGFSACVGQSALTKVGASISGAITARGDIVHAHSRFQKDAEALGLDWTVAGPMEVKGPDVPETPRPIGRMVRTS